MDSYNSSTKPSPLQEKKSQSIDWASIAESVALRLFGEPNLKRSSRNSLRWGNKGSKRLDRGTGCWKDFESGQGGGVMDLIKSELGCDKTQALAWLQNQGLIGNNRPRSPGHSLNRTTPDQNHTSEKNPVAANTEPSAEQKQKYARGLWSESSCISVDPQHPARRWFAHRNLWYPRVTPPVGLRYLKDHKDGPCLIVLVAPLSDWIEAFPAIPAPSGIQRILIDGEGRKRFSEGIDKYSLGTIQENVFSIGNTDAKHVTVCEGVADCLALASRLEGLHICTFGTSGMKADTFTPLERIPDRKISICCDNDSAGKEQAEKLRTGLIGRGIPALIEIPPPPNKDFAALAETEPWTELCFDLFKERASGLEQMGITKHEAERLALIHAIDRKDAMNSFKEIKQNAENMPEETINEAKQNQEHREQQDQEKADALKLLESLKKGFENESLSPEDAEKVRDALRVLEPDSQAIIKIHFANLYENENSHNESITKLKNLTYEYEDLSTTDFNSHESKEREWIIPGWLPANRVGLFSGEGEMGKSHLALQLALAVSIQLENKNQEQSSVYFLKKVDNGSNKKKGNMAYIEKHGPVAYATWEDEIDEMKNRAQNMEKTLNWSDNNGPKYDFIPFDLVGRGPLWAPSDRGSGHISTIASLTPLGKKLRKACEEKKVCLLIIDALASAFGSNENDRGLVRAFMSSWDAWGRNNNCAVLFIGHPPKKDASYSGNTDWFNASRTVWTLTYDIHSDNNNEKKEKVPMLTCIKSNYAKRPNKCSLKYDRGTWLEIENSKNKNNKEFARGVA